MERVTRPIGGHPRAHGMATTARSHQVVLLQVQLQDRVLDGREHEADVLRVCAQARATRVYVCHVSQVTSLSRATLPTSAHLVAYSRLVDFDSIVS